ncbi:uncharacterized protein K444DRAFT_619102 [Hyaloscypha bicolor E]|uniref:Uncharacterized protein n=1 Tax=Hyaloscypha bicolor E TaxID=1095630 RepID=A0A2J6SS19_9HELO|nr:uncharacterized protein K444DRAFT_619102 [Hyaloscypha bicolor E]PMD53574.1 hypothetical protein K444DRAFT_619102 [Hyaloscypha bicolor E]
MSRGLTITGILQLIIRSPLSGFPRIFYPSCFSLADHISFAALCINSSLPTSKTSGASPDVVAGASKSPQEGRSSFVSMNTVTIVWVLIN